MRTRESKTELSLRSAEALKLVLSGVSTIKLKEIQHPAAIGERTEFVAYVEVCGRSHTLACKVNTNGHPKYVREALDELHEGAIQFCENAIPVLIAPYLSPEAQALCKEANAGFLDLEGNARIELGEVFIGKRALPARVEVDPMLLALARTGPSAPIVYIASNKSGTPARIREGATAGIAVA